MASGAGLNLIMELHINGQKLGAYVKGTEELNEGEQGHLRTCETCSDLFRELLLSTGEETKKPD